MQAALESVDGVENVLVDFAGKKATVTCASGCDTKALVAALEGSGFGGMVAKE